MRPSWSRTCLANVRVKLRQLMVLSAVSLTVATTSAQPAMEEQLFDRTGFASPNQPTWAALTDFELTLLNRLQSGNQPSSQDLLSLYLMASGDVRSAATVQTFQARIDEFFAEYPELERTRDERERGRRLLRAMHEHFLRADSRSPLAGYDADQSRLSELLRTGIYNCLSSSLLYLVLADQLGLTHAGVIMPSHAFVQITLPDGRIADVETTTADGFDVVRDAAFFERQASRWFSDRQLVVPTYEDYEQRRVVTAAGLGYESMWAQHTFESRMDYADRLRLAEIRGVLQSDRADAQHNRLVYYYREAEFLRQQEDINTANTLMARIAPFLASFEPVIPAGLFSDPVSTVPLLLLQAERANWLIQQGLEEQGEALALTVLPQADDAPLNNSLIRDLAYRAIHTRVTQLLQRGELAPAQTLLQQLPPDCHGSAWCFDAVDQLTIAQGRQYFEQRNWPRAISWYSDYLTRGLDTGNREIFASNLETAYLNQAEQHWFDEERDEAVAALEVCVIRAPVAQRCQQRLETMRQRR